MTNLFRARSKQPVRRRDELDPGDEMLLILGPDPRSFRKPTWPPEEARLRLVWDRHRAPLLGDADPAALPWAFWRFDGPPEARQPGPTQERLLLARVMSPGDAAAQNGTPGPGGPLTPARAGRRRRRPNNAALVEGASALLARPGSWPPGRSPAHLRTRQEDPHDA